MSRLQEQFRARLCGALAALTIFSLDARGVAPSDALKRLDALGMAERPGALAEAVARQQRPLINLLLEATVDPNAPDANGRTPLLLAVADREWRLAERLLKANADPNLADSRGITPLMITAGHGNSDMVTMLLARGAKCEALDGSNRSALHYALAARKAPIAHQLLDANAPVGIRDVDGRDELTLAVNTIDWTLVSKILERSERRTWDFAGRSALQQAVNANQIDRVRLVLSKHAGPPTPEGCKEPLLVYAVAANDLRLARLLLEAGADPNTTLSSPVEERFLEYVPQKTLRHYLSEEEGMTALMVAAGLGHVEAVKLLLEKGAERGRATRSKYRLVPLYFAAWGEHAECMQALIADSPRPEEYRIEISLASQNATLFRNGAAAFSTGISTGRAGFATPTGRFVVTDKKAHHVSSIYKVKMPWFMRLSCKDFGMHEGHVPDYPASHGCIRVPSEAAKKLFREVPIGTLVTIVN